LRKLRRSLRWSICEAGLGRPRRRRPHPAPRAARPHQWMVVLRRPWAPLDFPGAGGGIIPARAVDRSPVRFARPGRGAAPSRSRSRATTERLGTGSSTPPRPGLSSPSSLLIEEIAVSSIAMALRAPWAGSYTPPSLGPRRVVLTPRLPSLPPANHLNETRQTDRRVSSSIECQSWYEPG
jgi:hypothetical protein